MNFKADVNSEDIKFLIDTCNEPLIFKNALDCDLFKWDLKKWEDLLENENLQFRCGKNCFTKDPQWERTTELRSMKFKEFVTHAECNENDWMYFDYKYLKEWFQQVQQLRQNISWDAFGLKNMTVEDSTIWIGSKGAHTPCHMDTYGCNIIVQIFGRKQWLIFPPEVNLQPTRVPYEESSIYSKLNFFSPSESDFRGINHCRKIILSPGDVLFLPHKWWHYVENLDMAISMNLWVPMEIDNDERLNEALVQLLIKQVTGDLNDEEKNVVLNPNVKNELAALTFKSALGVVNTCKNLTLEKRKNKRFKSEEKTDNVSLSKSTNSIIEKYTFIEKTNPLNTEQFKLVLRQQTDRFRNTRNPESTDKLVTNSTSDVISLINAVSHPEVISLIQEKFLN